MVGKREKVREGERERERERDSHFFFLIVIYDTSLSCTILASNYQIRFVFFIVFVLNVWHFLRFIPTACVKQKWALNTTPFLDLEAYMENKMFKNLSNSITSGFKCFQTPWNHYSLFFLETFSSSERHIYFLYINVMLPGRNFNSLNIFVAYTQ